MTRSPRWLASIVCAGAILTSLSLVGCSREADEWRAAQAADTVASYEQFLRQYPGSTHATDATTRVAQLAEDEAWQLATSQDTLAGYQQFVGRYPEGKWAQEARVRIENFSLPASADSPAAVMAGMAGTPAKGAAPAVASAAAPEPPSVKSVPVPAPAAAPAPAKPAPAKPASAAKLAGAAKPAEKPANGFGAQLGAYSTKEKADAAWQTVSKQFKPELASAKYQIVQGKGANGTVYRLQVPEASEATARDLCARLKPKGQACVVYHP